MTFEQIAVRYFTTQVSVNGFQRVDAVECFSPLSEFWFWEFRLNRLVRRGVLRSRKFGSIRASCRDMRSYGIALEGGS